MSEPVTFELGNCGPTSRNPKDLDDRDVCELWQELAKNLAETKIVTSSATAAVHADWTAAAAYIAKTAEDSARFFRSGPSDEELRDIPSSISTPPSVTLSVNAQPPQQFNALGELHLHLTFVAMNVAWPGSMDLSHAKTTGAYPHGVDLSATWFEFVRILPPLEWPVVERLPLVKTWEWLLNTGIARSQLMRSSAARAAVSLLQISRSPTWSPANLIWLSLALESLLGSPRTEIATTLRKRLFLIFGPPSEHAATVRRTLQDLYDLRSRFVHGQLPIPITTDNELLDEELYAWRERILDATTFATRIVVALLQELVKRSWRAFEFCESVCESQPAETPNNLLQWTPTRAP